MENCAVLVGEGDKNVEPSALETELSNHILECECCINFGDDADQDHYIIDCPMMNMR